MLDVQFNREFHFVTLSGCSVHEIYHKPDVIHIPPAQVYSFIIINFCTVSNKNEYSAMQSHLLDPNMNNRHESRITNDFCIVKSTFFTLKGYMITNPVSISFTGHKLVHSHIWHESNQISILWSPRYWCFLNNIVRL